jgi:hypothetical protein
MSLNSLAQIDPNVPGVNYTYDMKLVMPKLIISNPLWC